MKSTTAADLITWHSTAHLLAISLLGIVIQGMSSFHDINSSLAFYGVYHRDPMNQIIHFFGVPLIIWSMLVFLSHLNLPFVGDNWTTIQLLPFGNNEKPHRITYATVLIVMYIGFYFYLDRFGGKMFAPFAYFLYTSAVSFTLRDQERAKQQSTQSNTSIEATTTTKRPSWVGTGRALKQAFLVHIFAWYVQIHPGHRVIEGATPAVLKSVGGALTIAPLFAYYEGLWFLGMNKDLQDSTLELVEKYTVELCAQDSSIMKACESVIS